MKKILKDFYYQLIQASKIVDVKKWIRTSLLFGMAFMGLFVVVVLVILSLVQYGGGVTPYLVDLFPQSYLMLQKIDKSFGEPNTFGLLLFFIPVALLMIGYVLYLMENYLDKLLGFLQERSFVKRAALYWTLLALVPIPYYGSWAYSIFSSLVPMDFGDFFALEYLIAIGILFLSIFSYVITYKVLSKQIFDWQSSIKAGLVAGITFEIFKYIFIIFLKNNMEFAATKSLVIGFVLFGIWFCVNGAIYALSGIIGYYIQFRKVFNQKNRNLLLISEGRSTREIALICLLELIKRVYNTKGVNDYSSVGLTVQEICEHCVITPKRAKNILLHLKKVKLVRILYDDEVELVVLNFFPENLKLVNFISIIEERKDVEDLAKLPDNKASAWFWLNYQEGLDKSFKEKTMKDLYETQVG